MTRPASLRRDLVWSHMWVASVGGLAFMLVLASVLYLRGQTHQVMVQDVPSMNALSRLSKGVNGSLAALRGWVSLPDESLRLQLRSIWSGTIRPSQRDWRALVEDDVEAAKMVQKVSVLINRLEVGQRWVEDVAHAPGNLRALDVVHRRVDPIMRSMYAAMEVLLSRTDGVHGNPLHMDVMNLQASSLRTHAALERYVRTGESVDEAAFRDLIARFEALVQTIDAQVDKMTDRQAAQWAIYRREARAFGHFGREAMSIRMSPTWNLALYSLSTELIPLASDIIATLDTISKDRQHALEASGDHILRAGYAALIMSVFVLLGLIVLVPVLSRRAAHRVTEPLLRLRDAAADMADNKTDSKTLRDIPVQRMDEVGQLSVSFNKMRRAIESRETQLTQSLHQAEAANNAKAAFLSSMSHELRTPLNAVIGFSQVLEGDPRLNDETRPMVLEISKGAKILLRLVDSVLTLSNIDDESLPLAIDPLDTQLLLEICLPEYERWGREKGIVVTSRFTDTPPPIVLADIQGAATALRNVLSNAVSYSEAEATIEVVVETVTPSRVRISVIDTGNGIPTGCEERVFEPFDRLGRENSIISGLGIGLVIAKKLVEQMNGTIGFSSTEGEGATFWIEFPVYKPTA